MRWSGGRRSGNIEDRRGMGGIAAGGLGAGGLVVAAIAYFVFGVSPEDALNLAQGGAPAEQHGVVGSPQDEAGAFVDVIETSTTDVWSKLLSGYRPPAGVVLYDAATTTACGTGQAAMGPFYCPNDRKVYLDLSFWRELETTYGARGEFARAYVIAHEIGHHVQNLTGEMDKSRRLGARGVRLGAGGAAGRLLRRRMGGPCGKGRSHRYRAGRCRERPGRRLRRGRRHPAAPGWRSGHARQLHPWHERPADAVVSTRVRRR